MQKIYLDNNATTALDPRVLQAMLVDLNGPPANPSSAHSFGKRAKALLMGARAEIASFFQVQPEEIIFTSGGTESINLFLRGMKGHLITTEIEHSCLYKTAQELENKGLSVSYLPINAWGAPLPEDLLAALRPDTKAIALSAANNETGVKLDVEAFAKIALERGIPLLIDAVAFIGKEPFVMHPGITALAVSGHKFHAPKGTGVLVLRSSCKIAPLLTGGFQEYAHRAGTENLAGILGLAEGFRILSQEQTAISRHLLDLRTHFESTLRKEIPGLQIHGEGPRISNTTCLSFPGIDGETLLIHLDMAGIAASLGSACASGAIEPSRVLLKMGISHKIARSSIRFSMGRVNSRHEIDLALERLLGLVR